jgi:hypothetical protein
MSADTLLIQTTDSAVPTPASARATFVIPIVNPVTMSCSPPTQTVGVAASIPVILAGGTAPYTLLIISQTGTNSWSVSGNNIVGTPTAAETDSLILLAFDANGIPQSITVSITVTGGGGGGTLFLLFPASVPGGVGIPMAFTMQAYGPGLVNPITWQSASVGALDPTSGVWTFTPVGAGSQVVNITFQDAASNMGSGSFTCVIT